MQVLGIDVDESLLQRWTRWLAPELQPFFAEDGRSCPAESTKIGDLTPELRDTYKVWRLPRSTPAVWLGEQTFGSLPRAQRATLVRQQARLGRGGVPTVPAWSDIIDPHTLRAQADGKRFVWWPSLVESRAADILSRVLLQEGPPSRHREVGEQTCRRCAELLPLARDLSGTFPAGSGPNCFGTVMAAAGVGGVAEEWMQQEPFLTWLGSACGPGSRGDDIAGTVLVWRDRDGLPVHAAVTVGDGWALEKPAQTWSTPRTVLRVADIIRINRCPGQRLERHSLREPIGPRLDGPVTRLRR